ncbi:IQ domain-containing protein E [Discoglossus pictus]
MSWVSSENGTEAEELDTPHKELYQLLDDGASATTYESDTEKRVKKKKSNKPPKSPKSPYLSNTNLYPKKAPVWRSLKGTGVMHTENPMAKFPRQLWLASLKQGNGLTQPLKSDSDIGQAWINPSSSTPEYLKEALGMKKPKYSRSASTGYIPGTPDYKEKEDMYDQIIDLKKMLQAQKSESDIMKTKVRRLEEENSRKDRQIEQLLDPSRSSEFARSLVDKRSDSSLIVNNLKQKILKLEKQCKEKDNQFNKLQTELKATSLEEMKIAMETYYDEIQRLQILLANTEATARSPPESKDSQKRQKALTSAVAKLSKKVKELQEENHSLKADLDRAMAPSPTSTRSKGYSEWSKSRLVRKLSELEKKHENTSSSSAEKEKSARDGGVSGSGQEAASSNPKPDLNEECERLKNLVKKIKEDRAALQILLGTKESEIKKLQQEKADLQRAKEKNVEREEIQRLNQKIKKMAAELEDEKREKENVLEAMKKAQNESPTSRPSSARSAKNASPRPESASSSRARERQQQQEAAQVIQKNWRMYKSKKEDYDLDEVAVVLQSALLGHLARQKMLSTSTSPRSKSPRRNSFTQQDSDVLLYNSSPDIIKEEDEAVSLLQSSFRAHMARTKMLEQSSYETKGRDSPGRKIQRENSRSPVSRKSSSQDVRYSFGGESSGEVNEECIEELPSEEEAAEEVAAAPKRSQYRNRSPHTPAVSRKSPQPAEDLQSDDSDDIIVVSPKRPARRKDSDF